MTETDTDTSARSTAASPRSLPVSEWPDADRQAWEAACRPGIRLKPGGSADYLAEVSREDFARRYGAFLEFLQRRGNLDLNAAAAAQVTPSNVEPYITELNGRVRSVTAELLTPGIDYSWLAEIQKDLALAMEPRSKFDRTVFTQRLAQAGLTLVAEAKQLAKNDLDRARGVRNGLMIALLAHCPMRIKNFATLEIGRTFRQVQDSWWIALPRQSTKTKRFDERRVPEILNDAIDVYLEQSRPDLLGSREPTDFLWISSRTGRRMTTKNLGTLISKITYRTLGVDVSPHLFRTAAATTAAMYGGNTPHLASAVLGHTDSRVTEEHYTRCTSIEAAKTYAAIIRRYLST
jgi:site-specific recombinase XerD